jgi:hypothetical protein
MEPDVRHQKKANGRALQLAKLLLLLFLGRISTGKSRPGAPDGTTRTTKNLVVHGRWRLL